MSAFHDNALMGASGQQGYQISRSVRLRSSASAYFNRTPASAGSSQKFTMSCWVKIGSTSQTAGEITFLNAGDGTQTNSTNDAIQLRTNGTALTIACLGKMGLGSNYAQFSALLRDYSAWYHIVISIDTTQATQANRCRAYINGVEQTAYAANSFTLNYSFTYINSTSAHLIGKNNEGGGPAYADAYFAEMVFVDGQQLTASSFGETDVLTGVWKPKKYAGTYGTNGFYLNFSDNSSNTATTIGKDYSGNGNNWTPNNISVTSGVTYDSMIDSPTMYADGGNGRGNYCVLNPLDSGSSSDPTNGNLDQTVSGSSTASGDAGSFTVTTGKWYWEVTATLTSNDAAAIGILRGDLKAATAASTNPSGVYYYAYNGNKYVDGTSSAYGASWNTLATAFNIGVALDADAGTLTFYRNGTSQGSITLPSNTNGWKAHSSYLSGTGSVAINANFGQRPFSYTPPTGFKALNTFNLPEPTIKKGNQYFDVVTRTTSGTSGATISSLNFKPDLIWSKLRNSSSNHYLWDSVRGASKYIHSNLTNAEGTDATFLASFNSNGYTMGATEWGAGNSAVEWCLNAGSGTSSSNTNGSITSTVSVNATAGFSIATYTGTGANATVGHGLGVAPSMIIIKCRDSATDPSWIVGHTGIVMGTGRLILNGTDANSNAGASSLWNSTAANSSVFSLGTYSSVNQNTLRFVAYLFAEVAGFSAFGSYTGNGSSDGPFVYLGFRPRFVLVKASSAVENWLILDSSTGAYNVISNTLLPNSSAAESTGNNRVDFLSNGFKARASAGVSPNASGVTYIYAAFAENPMKFSLAR